jgi:acyl carrier protein
MDSAAVRERVRAVVRAMAPVRRESVTSSTLLAGDLGYDSLGLVQVAARLEDEFDLPDAPDEGVLDVETVGDVEDRLLSLLEAGAPEVEAS